MANNTNLAMTEKLKPCPFCGGEAEVRMFTATLSFVQCKSCLAGTSGFLSEHEAVNSWNRRYTVLRMVRQVIKKWLTILQTKI